ncbi:MAG: glycosyltransferase family 8 protein [Ruminococcus sp.]|nr:glycosyltransferase family 8 protein [Ruminococcus sp.]
MNVVYSSSDSYASVAGVSMYSLLCNNKSSKELNIYIVDNNISEKNKEKFRKMCSDFGRSLTFIPIADIEKLAGTKIDIGRWNISTFGRLFEASLLPDSVEKVIHIDCDTMVMSSLEDLWNRDMEGKIVAGSLECIGDSYKTEIGLSKDDTYINAGNIMLNLKKIREDNTEELFRSYIKNHSHLSFVDQAVLNACVKSDEKLVVPLDYNAYSIIYYIKYKNLKKVKRVTTFYSEEEVEKAVKKPAIVHFTTCFMDGSRPWIENNVHPLLSTYLDYKSKSPWTDTPIWKDPRNPLKRFAYKMFRTLPQGFVAWSIGMIHGVLIPFKNSFKK